MRIVHPVLPTSPTKAAETIQSVAEDVLFKIRNKMLKILQASVSISEETDLIKKYILLTSVLFTLNLD